jgi:hypothetical protein
MKKRPKKYTQEQAIRKKVFAMGTTRDAVNMTFHNFASRWVDLRMREYPGMNEKVILAKLYLSLKIDTDEGLRGLSINQVKYRVRKLKEKLDIKRIKQAKTLQRKKV